MYLSIILLLKLFSLSAGNIQFTCSIFALYFIRKAHLRSHITRVHFHQVDESQCAASLPTPQCKSPSVTRRSGDEVLHHEKTTHSPTCPISIESVCYDVFNYYEQYMDTTLPIYKKHHFRLNHFWSCHQAFNHL